MSEVNFCKFLLKWPQLIEGFIEYICLVPHSLYIMLEAPGEAEVGGDVSEEGNMKKNLQAAV